MPESSKTHHTHPHGWLLTCAVAGFAFLAATLVPVRTTTAQGAPEVDIQASTDGIAVEFFATTPRNVLTFSVRVVGADNFVFEQRIEDSALQWIPPENLTDGLYSWEAWVITADVGAEMRELTPALEARQADHWFDDEVKQTHISSGVFRVENGLLKDTSQSEEGSLFTAGTRRVARAILDFLVPSAHAQFGDFDDFVSIRCTETNCTGFEEKSRLNLNATDDSTVGENSWRIWNNVGSDHEFQISEGASTPRLTILQGGNVGIGTEMPSAALEIGGVSPRIQMNRAGAEWHFGAFSDPAFGIQNLAGFSVPFGILGDAPTLSLFLTSSGAGFGTAAPAAALHVQRVDNTAQARVTETGASAVQQLFRLEKNGFPAFNFTDTSQSDVSWTFRLAGNEPNDRFEITKVGSGGSEFRVFANGDAELPNGVLIEASSRHIKDNIVELSADEVLEKLAGLPVHEWSYSKNLSSRHIGPMAEDFHAVFGLGRDDKGIAPKDLAGVALAAAKGLAERSATLEAETGSLRAENTELRTQLEHKTTELRDRLERENAELRDRLVQLEAILIANK